MNSWRSIEQAAAEWFRGGGYYIYRNTKSGDLVACRGDPDYREIDDDEAEKFDINLTLLAKHIAAE